MKQLLALICGAMLIVAYAQAQTDTTSSTTTSSPATTSMTSPATTSMTSTGSSTSNSGTVTDYTPGAAITIDPGTGKPARFVLGQKVQVVGPDGKAVANTNVKKNARVHLRLAQEGDRTVVEQINVESSSSNY